MVDVEPGGLDIVQDAPATDDDRLEELSRCQLAIESFGVFLPFFGLSNDLQGLISDKGDGNPGVHPGDPRAH